MTKTLKRFNIQLRLHINTQKHCQVPAYTILLRFNAVDRTKGIRHSGKIKRKRFREKYLRHISMSWYSINE